MFTKSLELLSTRDKESIIHRWNKVDGAAAHAMACLANNNLVNDFSGDKRNSLATTAIGASGVNNFGSEQRPDKISNESVEQRTVAAPNQLFVQGSVPLSQEAVPVQDVFRRIAEHNVEAAFAGAPFVASTQQATPVQAAINQPAPAQLTAAQQERLERISEAQSSVSQAHEWQPQPSMAGRQ